MSVFGTISKEDGVMPIHFDERDIISCVFHLGRVTSGCSTSFYGGVSHSKPGDKIHHVSFRHGTLKLFFFLTECYMGSMSGMDSVAGYR